MSGMEYKIEELVQIVEKLAEGYTSKESTSITYERAQQLMDAVLYCIHEADELYRCSLIKKDGLSAQEMYDIGASCVMQKTKETMEIYNEIIADFSSYGNECLHDTVVKGLPEFFKWYDCRYEPQNTILTLDYPVLVDLTKHTGIDKIYDFLICIQLEQKFLSRFPMEYVEEILFKYDSNYSLMIDNICEIVLMNVIGHILVEKEISAAAFQPEEYKRMRGIIRNVTLKELRESLKNSIGIMVREYYEKDAKLMEYLYQAVDNISVRIKTAGDNGHLDCIL